MIIQDENWKLRGELAVLREALEKIRDEPLGIGLMPAVITVCRMKFSAIEALEELE